MLNKRRAVRNTLARLGPQAGAHEVAAALAAEGIHVSEALVQRVRQEVLAELLSPRQGRAGPPLPLDRRRTRPFQKRPPRRYGKG
jgi:hypothetical protein